MTRRRFVESEIVTNHRFTALDPWGDPVWLLVGNEHMQVLADSEQRPDGNWITRVKRRCDS